MFQNLLKPLLLKCFQEKLAVAISLEEVMLGKEPKQKNIVLVVFQFDQVFSCLFGFSKKEGWGDPPQRMREEE